MSRKIVLGLGNTLQRDEGVGVYALKALAANSGDDTSFEFVDGGVLGFRLLPLIEEASHLLILDAVDVGTKPGTLVELSREEIPIYAGVKLSQHQVTFQEILGWASVRGRLPDNLYLLGVQPEDLSVGTTLSPVIQEKVGQIVNRADCLLRHWA